MKRPIFFLIILLALAAPAWAQDAVDPAAYVPSSTPIYLELDTSAAGQQAFTAAANLWLGMLGVPFQAPDSQTALDLVVANRLPAISSADIVSWVGNPAALVLNEGANPGISDFAFVLPIADEAGAQAFVDQLRQRTFDHEKYGSVDLYYAGVYTVAVGSSVIWLGSAGGVDALFRAAPENLAQSPGYQRVRAQLPAAPITGYVNGAWLQSELAALGDQGQPSLAAVIEAVLRVHPVESAFKTALLDGAPIDGLGIAVQANDQGMTADLAFALDAQIDTPDAPLTLAQLAPADSFVVLDSYDVTALTASVGGVASLLLPVQYVSAPSSAELSAPTATPPPPPDPAQALIAQVQPIITQVESLAGLSLDDLYGLIDGEYLFAVFPGDDGSTGAALWIDSSDPARVIDALETASKLVLTDPSGTQLVDVERTTVSGVPVAFVSLPGGVERLAIGANDTALFFTSERFVQQVIDAPAQSDARAWASAFEAGQNAALYLDPHVLDAAVLQQVRDPALPLTEIDGGLSISSDGVFKLHFTGIVGG